MGRYLQRKYYPAQTQNVTGAGGRDNERKFGVARQVGTTRDGAFGLLVLICYVAKQNVALLVFATPFYICLYMVLQKRLVCNCNTIVCEKPTCG